MFWNRYFGPSFCLLSAIAFLNYVGQANGYFEALAWYDVMMHFLGGLWVVLFAYWIAAMGYAPLRGLAKLCNLLVLALVVGVLWEVYELVFSLMDIYGPMYASDTMLDLVMDVTGAFLGAIAWRD